MKAMKTHIYTNILLVTLFALLTACGGGGGGIGGGLIPGLMTMNTAGVMSGGMVQLSIVGGLAPYTFSMYQGVGGTLADPWGGVTLSASGLVTIPDIGDNIDVIIVKVVDDLNRTKYFRVPVLGKPKVWFMANKISAVDLQSGFVATLTDQSGNGADATADCVANECPQYIGSDSVMNGMPSIYFDGTDDFMEFTNNVTGDITIALIFKSGAGAGIGGWAANSGLIQNSEYGISLNAAGEVTAGTNTGANLEFSSAVGYDNNQPHIVLITKGANSRVYVDSIGVGGNPVSGGGKSAGGQVYFGSNGVANFLLGSVPEIIIYQKDLGGIAPAIAEDRLILTRYLKDKYKVSLPAVPPPTVTITSAEPFDTDGLYSTQTVASFDYTYTGSGFADIYKVECQLDGGVWVDCRDPDEFATFYTKIYASVSDGLHTFIVKATDTDEKEANDTNGWTSDNTAPVCTIDDIDPVVATLSDGWGELTNFTMKFSCADDSPFAALNPECSVDGGPWGDCTSDSTHAIAGPLSTNDSSTFAVRATDVLGNGPGLEDTIAWQTDLEDPTCSITVEPSGVRMTNSESFIFSCNDGVGTIPVANKVQCSFDVGAYANCSSDTGHTLNGLLAGSHSLSIKVTDQAGRVSAVQTANWITDLVDPACTFTTTPGTYGGFDPQSVTFSCTDDSDLVLDPDCSIDGGTNYYNCDTDVICNAGTTTLCNVSSAVEGNSYTLHVRVTDHTLVRTSVAINTTWVSDKTDPTCTINGGTAPGYDPPEYTSAATVEYDCNDIPSGTMPIDHAECSLDGGGYANCSNTFSQGTGIKSGSHVMSGLSGGNHTLEVKGFDAAGREAAVVSHTWRNDIGRPTCTIVTAISGDRNNATENINVQCDDDIALNDPADQKPQCILDDVTAATVNFYTGDCNAATVFGGAYDATATYNTAALTDGSDYKLTVTITDSGGKVPVTDATTTWTTDTSAPTCALTTTPDGLVHDWNFENIAYWCDDNSLDFSPQRSLLIECRIEGNLTVSDSGWGPCDSYAYASGPGRVEGTHSFLGLVANNFTLSVRATDSAGNVSNSVGDGSVATWDTDLVAPVCSITTPIGAWYEADPQGFVFACTDDHPAFDAVYVFANASCDLDGGAGVCASGTTYSAALAATEGAYYFEVSVADIAGHVSNKPRHDWVYDDTDPTCSITAMSSYYVVNNTGIDPRFSCVDNPSTDGPSGITTLGQYECRLDGAAAGVGAWGACNSITDNPLAGLADDNWTFRVRTTDDAGNVGPDDTESWNTDVTFPTITAITTSRIDGTTRRVSFTLADPGGQASGLNMATHECSINGGGAWGACTDATYHNATALAGGETLDFRIRVVDNAGNLTTSGITTDQVLLNGRSVAECSALGGYDTNFFGTTNVCRLNAANCGAWAQVSNWSATSNVAGSGGDTTCTAGANDCNTGNHGWANTAQESCGYDDDHVISWVWSSYGNQFGFKSTEAAVWNVTTPSAALTCPIEVSECFAPGVDNNCTGDGGPGGVPVAEATHIPGGCVQGENKPGCLQTCTVNCSGTNPIVLDATITQIGCQ